MVQNVRRKKKIIVNNMKSPERSRLWKFWKSSEFLKFLNVFDIAMQTLLYLSVKIKDVKNINFQVKSL